VAAVERWDQEEDWRPTRAQKKAAWDLAHASGGGCFVRSLDDGRNELLMMHRGEFRRYFILRDGQAMLVESAPRTSRYSWGWGLTVSGIFLFVVCLVLELAVFGGPNGELPGFTGLPAVFAGGLIFIGRAMAPRIQPPVEEGWTELRYGDNG